MQSIMQGISFQANLVRRQSNGTTCPIAGIDQEEEEAKYHQPLGPMLALHVHMLVVTLPSGTANENKDRVLMRSPINLHVYDYASHGQLTKH